MIGLLVWGGVIPVKGDSLTAVAIVCFAVGGVYLVSGIIVALLKRRRDGP